MRPPCFLPSAPAARVPGVLTALRIITLPYYCVALLQPHATLLCWGTLSASHYVQQAILASPTWAARAGLPDVLLPASVLPLSGTGEAAASGTETSRPSEQDAAGGVGGEVLHGGDAELLLFLGRRYAKRRKAEAAASCFRLALQLRGECREAREGLEALRPAGGPQ